MQISNQNLKYLIPKHWNTYNQKLMYLGTLRSYWNLKVRNGFPSFSYDLMEIEIFSLSNPKIYPALQISAKNRLDPRNLEKAKIYFGVFIVKLVFLKNISQNFKYPSNFLHPFVVKILRVLKPFLLIMSSDGFKSI